MCGGAPDPIPAPEPSWEERQLQIKQGEAIDLQNELLRSQMAETKAAREEMKEFYSIYDKETMQGLLSAELELTQKSLDMMNEYIDREPTELELKLEDISLLQAERTEKALRGELPVSEGTQQRYEEEKGTLQERLSRKIGGGWEESTPGIQAMGEFEKRWGALMDAERRGEISQGSSLLLAQMGFSTDLARAQSWQQPGSVANPTSAFGRGIGLLEGSSSYGYGASLSGLRGMGSSISEAYQPYQFYAGLSHDANKFNAEMAQRASEAQMEFIGGLAASGASAAGGMMPGMSDSRVKENVLPITDALRKVLALSGYSFDYKKEFDTGEIGRRFGVMADDLEKVEPDMVFTDPGTGIKYVKMDFHGLFVEAFKELAQKVEDLESKETE
jgi:hypothetical protein